MSEPAKEPRSLLRAICSCLVPRLRRVIPVSPLSEKLSSATPDRFRCLCLKFTTAPVDVFLTRQLSTPSRRERAPGLRLEAAAPKSSTRAIACADVGLSSANPTIPAAKEALRLITARRDSPTPPSGVWARAATWATRQERRGPRTVRSWARRAKPVKTWVSSPCTSTRVGSQRHSGRACFRAAGISGSCRLRAWSKPSLAAATSRAKPEQSEHPESNSR